MKKAIGLFLVLVCVASFAAAQQTLTIVVFPFENRSASSDLGWISEAFSEVLSTRLAGRGRFIIERKERNKAYQQLGVPPDAILTLASEYKVAQILGVDWAIVGSFKVTGQQMTAETQLLDMHGLRMSPPIRESGALSQLVRIQTLLAWRVLASYDKSFSVVTEQDFLDTFPPLRLDAFENYIRGILATDANSKVQFLTAAAGLNPPDHRAAFALGEYYFHQKDYQDSAIWISKLDPKDANYLTALFLRGVDNFMLGQNKESESAFLALSKQIPLNEVWNNLGVLEARRADYKDALASFERAFAGDSSDPEYAYNVGVCYCDLKEYRSGAEYLEKALRKSPDGLAVRTMLAYALRQEGDSAASQAQLEWVAEHDGSSMADLNTSILPQPRLKKTFNGAAFRMLAVAVNNSLESELEKLPPKEHGQVHLERGEQFIKQGRYPEAIRELTEALSLIPASVEAQLSLGQAYELNGQHRKALAQFRASLALNDNAVTHLWMAHAYLSLHQTSKALSQCRDALSLDPGNTDANNLMNSIERQEQNLRKDP
ncbi:MAG: tetratricopeptide repeat protein [Terriglobia bacterium]